MLLLIGTNDSKALGSVMKISVLTDILVIGFYGYIGDISDISVDIFI